MAKITKLAKVSHHAYVRMQQRGIDAIAIDYLLSFGEERLANKGASIVYFDKGTKKKLFAQLDKDQRVKLEHQVNAYLILGADGNIVTVGHRTRRFSRN